MLEAGTVVNIQQIDKLEKIGVDFIVCPGLSIELIKSLLNCKIPFLVLVHRRHNFRYRYGIKILQVFSNKYIWRNIPLKTYQLVFPEVSFCPTGGINKDSFNEYLELENVLSVGGSWMVKNLSK